MTLAPPEGHRPAAAPARAAASAPPGSPVGVIAPARQGGPR